VNNLIEAFHEYFELAPATTEDLRNTCFRLRYEVFCKEFRIPGFEAWKYPNQFETDQYDETSIHCLLIHRPSSSIAGTVRLILLDSEHPDFAFPAETVARRFQHSIDDFYSFPRSSIGEISRLILAPRFRQRKGEHEFPFGTDRVASGAPVERRRFPHPVLGLIAALFRLSHEYNITHWYAIMEPALNRLLRHFSLHLTPITPIVFYHGRRQAHFESIVCILNRLQNNPEILGLMTSKATLRPEHNLLRSL
jgi:N-acyl amino acid synthase of PEP-CTERM/exosortase system